MQAEAAEKILKQAKIKYIKEMKEFNPDQLVLCKKYVLSSKSEGYNAGLEHRWLGPFKV